MKESQHLFWNTLILMIVFGIPCCVFALEKTIICDEPMGTRVDYFLNNTFNLQNQTFLMGKDKVNGMKPKIVLQDNNKVSFIISDANDVSASSLPKTGNMTVLIYNENQISFTGLVNDAPILATYYPKFGILIYSQQSIWPNQIQGARAVIFYSKCVGSDPAGV